MQRISYQLFLMVATLLFVVSCTEDLEQPAHTVEYCVKVAWQDGRASAETRANTDLLNPQLSDIAIVRADYPSRVDVHCSNGVDFHLEKGAACSAHVDFINYSSDAEKAFTTEDIEKNTLRFTARATIDGGDVLEGTAEFATIVGEHLQFTLHHTKTLVRFGFKIDEKYDRIRYIKIKEVKLNNAAATYPLEKQSLVVDASQNQLLCYLYIDPTQITVSSSLTLACTYDVYDKDAKFDGTMSDDELAMHLTRSDVTNANTFSFQKIYTDEAKTQHVGKIEAGKYYDLSVTINPDFLYVLSDDDEKQLLIQ